MSERQYGGQALAYMRVLTRGKFPPAASCRALFNTLKEEGSIGRPNKEPKPGDLLLWPTVNPYGDCTLYLGNRLMLMMAHSGIPIIVRLDYYARATFYILGDGHE